MLLLTKNKLSIYRKFNLDIWGVFKSALMLRFGRKFFNKMLKHNMKFLDFFIVSKRTDWICRFFFRSKVKNFKKKRNFNNIYFYRLDVIEPEVFYRRKKRKFVKSDVNFRLMRIFYLLLSYRNIRKFLRMAKSRNGLFASNYLLFLESRIIALIYRCSLLSNIFECIRFIRKGNVIVNKKFFFFPNKRVNFFSLVKFKCIFKGYVYWVLYRRLVRKAVMSSIPRFIFFSYQFLFFFLIKYPKRKDFVNPFPMDIFKISVFAGKKY